MGGVVDQQLSRDLVLLDDLRGTLNHVMGWDHTQGGLDPAAGGSTGGANQDKAVVVDLPLAGASATAVDQHTTSKTSSLSEGSGGAATASRGREQLHRQSLGVSGEERSSAGKGDMIEHIPLALGRRAENDRGGHQGDGGTEVTKGPNEESGASRAAGHSTAPRRSSGGVASSTAACTVSSVDTGSTTTSTTTLSSGSCVEWLRKQQKRATPTPLTDDERMSLLQHVRPSVFGEPAALDQQRRSAVACARPRSAAATADAGHAFRHSRHDPPRASTARVRSREGGRPGGSDAAGRMHRASGCSSGVSPSKYGGVLVHDSWVAGEGESPSGSFSVSTGAGQASPRGSRSRPGVLGGTGGSGGARQVSLVNSVAFGVNMGVLDALSDTTASATAATAFASAAAGESTTTSKSLLPAMRPWQSSEGERRNSSARRNVKYHEEDSRRL